MAINAATEVIIFDFHLFWSVIVKLKVLGETRVHCGSGQQAVKTIITLKCCYCKQSCHISGFLSIHHLILVASSSGFACVLTFPPSFSLPPSFFFVNLALDKFCLFSSFDCLRVFNRALNIYILDLSLPQVSCIWIFFPVTIPQRCILLLVQNIMYSFFGVIYFFWHICNFRKNW